MRVDWAQRALTDLVQIHEYIAQDSAAYAERTLARLISAVDPLAAFPRVGRSVPEAPEDPSLRELLVESYRIVYRVAQDRILVLTILHGSRDLDRLATKPWNLP